MVICFLPRRKVGNPFRHFSENDRKSLYNIIMVIIKDNLNRTIDITLEMKLKNIIKADARWFLNNISVISDEELLFKRSKYIKK